MKVMQNAWYLKAARDIAETLTAKPCTKRQGLLKSSLPGIPVHLYNTHEFIFFHQLSHRALYLSHRDLSERGNILSTYRP